MTDSRHLFAITPSLTVVALSCAVFLGGLFLAPATAWASDAEAQIAQHLSEAQDGYDMLEFEESIDAIRQGVRVADQAGIRNADVGQLYIVLGLIQHAEGDDDTAIEAFVKALELYPATEVDPMYTTPDVEELMDRATARADIPEPEPEEPDEPVADPTPDIDEPPPEEDVDPLTHSPINRADAGQPLDFIAEIPADLPVFRVHVHHRRYGEDDYQQEEMDPVDATGFALSLDGNQIRSSQIEYFITAIDRTGETLAESGRRSNPHRIRVIGTFDGDDPIAQPDDDPSTPEIPADRDDVGFYGTLTAGTDFGFLPGGTPPTANFERSVSPGLAPAFAHSFLDLGWRITPENNIGLYFRWQFSPPQNFDHIREQHDNPDHISTDASFWQHRDECFGIGLPGDCLLGLKYERVLTTEVPEFYSTVGFGVGRVRNWLKLKHLTSESDPDPICEGREVFEDDEIGQYCELRDTVRTGWFHFGVGGGMYFPVHDNFDLVADTYLMVLVPDSSVNLDINVGIRFRL